MSRHSLCLLKTFWSTYYSSRDDCPPATKRKLIAVSPHYEGHNMRAERGYFHGIGLM